MQIKGKSINRDDLVRRYDKYFAQRNDERIKELRKYVREYFTLTRQIPEAYVPRIFVVRWEDSNSLSTAITWSNYMCSVFPPTDLIILTQVQSNSPIVIVHGYLETNTLHQKCRLFFIG